jgi:hypothetical protein
MQFATQFDLKNDLPNYLSFFKELRSALGNDVLITSDTSSTPWLDPDTGTASTDLSAFGDLLDFVTVMVRGTRVLLYLLIRTHSLFCSRLTTRGDPRPRRDQTSCVSSSREKLPT